MAPHETKTTIDPKVIRKWAEERDGRPARVKDADEEGSGILRIDFGKPEPNLEEISWEDFARIFNESNLAFLYQEQKADGEQSTFFKFVDRDSVEIEEDEREKNISAENDTDDDEDKDEEDENEEDMDEMERESVEK